MDNYFSLETVADILSKSKFTIESWQKSGKLIPELDPTKYDKPYLLKQLLIFEEFKELANSKWDLEEKIKPLKDYQLIELFAGAGGLALGLEKAGFKSVLLNEKEGKVDLLTGGFPCQPFSYAGKKLGLNDIRGTLVFEMIRSINEIQPKVFLAENVKGLKTDDNGKTLASIISFIEQSGYTLIENHIYKTMMYKVPQKRERLILIGVRNDLVDKLIFERPSYYYRILTVRDALYKGELYVTDVPISIGQKYPKRKEEIMSFVPEGGYWRDLPLDLQREYMKGSFGLAGGKTGIARRLSFDEPSLTLTCSPAQKQTERCHPIENRPLTTREYARIQTFPDDWGFKGSAKWPMSFLFLLKILNIKEKFGIYETTI